MRRHSSLISSVLCTLLASLIPVFAWHRTPSDSWWGTVALAALCAPSFLYAGWREWQDDR